MLAAVWRIIVVAILVVTSLLVGPSAHQAAAATCTSSVGPGIPAPTSLPSGIPGFHASWYGQSGYPTLCPGERATSVVAYYNSGSQGWVLGRMGEVAYLGTWNPSPGQDQPTPLGGDGTNGSPNTGWPRYNRIAIQPAAYVGPGQVAWFQFQIQAPTTPGYYKLYLRPLVEGSTWMEDYGVFWQVTVLNPDGTPPPPAALPGCSDWPSQLGLILSRLPNVSSLCLIRLTAARDICPNACYFNNPVGRIEFYQADFLGEVADLAHEITHGHQQWKSISSGVGRTTDDWPKTDEGLAFQTALDRLRTTDPNAYSFWFYRGSAVESFANVSSAWYYPATWPMKVTDSPILTEFAQKWLPK